MKIDMHCHVREGSIDSKVPIEEFIKKLQSKGIGGMLVTDHDTYNGYRHWKNTVKGRKYKDFVVLKGIEYDTLDAGHILIIMPQGEKYLSFTNTKRWQKSPELIEKFDFIETFNACEPPQSNEGAKYLAEKYGKPGTGGSDAHKLDCVGMGYTEFPVRIETELDLIRQIREKGEIQSGGEYYTKTTKDKIGKFNKLLIFSFWFYNRGGALLKKHTRKKKINKEQPLDAIDPIEIPYLDKIKRKH